MNKQEPIKETAKKLFTELGISKAKELVAELNKLINLTKVQVYYVGNLNSDVKEAIHKWLKNKINGDFDVTYIEDKSLIAGFRIVYKDFIYDSSVLNSFKNEIWKNKIK